MSWIDPRIGLPEDDPRGDPGPGCTRSRLVGQRDYRFANLLEARIVVENGHITDHRFTQASRLYRSPSFGGIPSHAFPIQRNTRPEATQVTFWQTVGARTVSSEAIGSAVGRGVGGALGGPILGPLIGAPVGERAGRGSAQAVMSFPPIWTMVELLLRADGTFRGRVIRHSLFPSMTFVVQEVQEQPSTSAGGNSSGRQVTPRRGPATPRYVIGDDPNPNYDARPNYDNWYENGWGANASGSTGPTRGNPWRAQNTSEDRAQNQPTPLD